MYLVRIQNMPFHAHIGFFEEEKKLGQRVEVDIEVEIETNEAIQDKLDHTVSYALFYEAVEKTVKSSSVDLIETLTEDIIQAIQAVDDKVANVKVRLRKYGVPIDGIFDHIEIEMES